MAIPCAVCSVSFKNLSAFHFHFSVQHPSCTYECVIAPCRRVYADWGSFRKHIIKKHGEVLNTAENPLPEVGTSKTLSVENNSDYVVVDSFNAQEESLCEILTTFIQNEIREDFRTLIKSQADILVAKLSSKRGLPRSLTSSLLEDFTSFFSSGFLETFQDFVLTLLNVADVSEEDRRKVSDFFDIFKNPFEHLSTEYLRLKHFEELGDYIRPLCYVITERMERVKTKDGFQFEMKDVTGVFIPLGKVLSNYFKLPHVLEDALAYRVLLGLDQKYISNFSQCESWKRKLAKFSSEDFVLPIMLFYDDFEPNNVLGPHCEKLGASYISLPFLPPECQSNLENIILALLFNSDDRQCYGNAKAFKPLVSELKKLENEGIVIQKPDGSVQKIFLVIGLVLGDNLGLNSICGFVESFTSTHFCRCCKVSKIVSESMLVEDTSLLRTPENYAEDVLMDDYHETGIKEECVFEDVDSFETPTDIGFDPFHDLLEGVAHYTMLPILQHFHSIFPSFLENLNDRMYMFEYGIDGDNKPPSILPDHLKKNKLKMTGAEMLTFVRLFGVFVGDLIREDDPYYQLYVLLHDIVIISISKRLPSDIGEILEVLVKEHHKLYKELTGLHLKPKHHFLLHYNSRIIFLFGPLALLSTIRFEAKHKILKLVANICCSRRNLPLTIAIKEQLSLCYRFVCKKSVRPDFTVGSGHMVNLREFEHYPAFSLTLPDAVFQSPDQFCAKWVDFCGTMYRQQMHLLLGTDLVRCPTFVKIELILIFNKEPLFIVSPLYTLGFNCHTRGYEVQVIPNQLNWFCLNHAELDDPFPLTAYRTADGCSVIIPRHLLLVD